MNNLGVICDSLRDQLEARNSARDRAIALSRQLIRACSAAIRALHRNEWENADAKLGEAAAMARDLKAGVAAYPELYHAGYTQDALKELAEAHITSAIIRSQPLPSPADLEIEPATYLKGLGEAATELRRFILDIMRREDDHSQEAELLLRAMDEIYDELVSFDFPDALTRGLRRQTDVVRGVLERTRGDLTNSLRGQKLRDALSQVEARLDSSNCK